MPKAKAPVPTREPAPAPRDVSSLDNAEDDLMQMQDRVNQLQSMLQMLGGLADEEEEVDPRRVPVPRPAGRPAPPSPPASPPNAAADQADSISASLAGLG